MRIPRCLHLAGVFLLVVYNVSQGDAAASKVSNNEIRRPSLLETLANVLQDRAILRSGPEKSKSLSDVLNKHRPTGGRKYKRPTSTSTTNPPKGALRSDILRQELAKETEGNCLAQLLCGPSTPTPASTKKPVNPVQDYAHLVKEFFELFGVDDIEEEKKDEKDENKKDDEDKESSDDDAEDDEEDEETGGKSQERNLVNITASLDDIISTSTSATITTVTTGATITEIPAPAPPSQKPKSSPFEDTKLSEVHKVTLEELIGDVMLTQEDFQNMRSSRSLVSVGELKQSKYIRRKLRELSLAKSEKKKLKIAGQIATSMRQPRQCRQFDKVASEVLSTCPLTSEVVRYFNSNLKNGSQIAIVKHHPNATEGGLVLLNDHGDRPHSYFLDNSPLVANTKISQDLKNPTTPDRFTTDLEYQIYDKNYDPKVDPTKLISIAAPAPPLPPKNKASIKNKNNDDDRDAESSENDDDEDDDNEEEEDDDDGEEDEENEDEGPNDSASQNDEDDNENDDEGQNDDDSQNDLQPQYPTASHHQAVNPRPYQFKNIPTSPTPSNKGRKWKLTKKQRQQIAQKQKKQQIKKKVEAQKPKTPRPTGMIKVYGIPQPSFDNEFTHISHQIGQGPVVIFDQDDYDANAPYPPGRPPIRKTPSRPKTNAQRQPFSKSQRWAKPTSKKTTASPQPQSSEEDEEDEEDNTSQNLYKSQNDYHQQQQTRGGQSPHFMTSAYGSYPAPRPQEYYRNGLPPRPRPSPNTSGFRPVGSPMSIRPEASVRGRLNFMPNPGAGLMRPFYHGNNNFYQG